MYTSPNFNGKKFVNTVPTVVSRPGTTWNTLWQYLTNKEQKKPAQPLGPFPVPASFPPANPDVLSITWIGHSTLLLEIEGKRFLTDPVWSTHSGPIPFVGPTRFFPPPLTLEQLPPLDGIILSHDHYDHLDRPTIKKLGQQQVPFYCPLGVDQHLVRWGIAPEQITTHDWWDETVLDSNLTLTATPARHFSGRRLFDRDHTLWCSWVIAGSQHRVYFGGDSGLFQGFDTIGEKLGPFDVTMLEIGAYHPNWGDIHMGPVSAIRAHEALKGNIMMPIHWGTFDLALHAWTEPVETLLKVAQEKGITLMLPVPGVPTPLPESNHISYWWQPS